MDRSQWGKQLIKVLIIAGVWCGLLLILIIGRKPFLTGDPDKGRVTWDSYIRKVFATNCISCHEGSGGLYLDTYENVLKGGDRGKTVIPGDGEKSILIQSLRGTYPGLERMPYYDPPLPDNVINTISAWIDSGAPKSAAAGGS